MAREDLHRAVRTGCATNHVSRKIDPQNVRNHYPGVPVRHEAYPWSYVFAKAVLGDPVGMGFGDLYSAPTVESNDVVRAEDVLRSALDDRHPWAPIAERECPAGIGPDHIAGNGIVSTKVPDPDTEVIVPYEIPLSSGPVANGSIATDHIVVPTCHGYTCARKVDDLHSSDRVSAGGDLQAGDPAILRQLATVQNHTCITGVDHHVALGDMR